MADLSDTRDSILNEVLLKMRYVADDMVTATKLDAPVLIGETRDSIAAEDPYLDGDTIVIFITTEHDDRVRWTDQGTVPHVIMPVNAKALYWDGAGYPRAIVHHPGARAANWFQEPMEARYRAALGAWFG